MNELIFRADASDLWSIIHQPYKHLQDDGYDEDVQRFNRNFLKLVVQAVQQGLGAHQQGMFFIPSLQKEDFFYALVIAEGVTLISSWVRINMIDTGDSILALSKWRNRQGVVMYVMVYHEYGGINVLVSPIELPDVTFYEPPFNHLWGSHHPKLSPEP
jgi:hypothetical protein